MGKLLPLTLLRVINPCHLYDPHGMSLPDDINMTLSLSKGFTLLQEAAAFSLETRVYQFEEVFPRRLSLEILAIPQPK
jgi:hypothetical protein